MIVVLGRKLEINKRLAVHLSSCDKQRSIQGDFFRCMDWINCRLLLAKMAANDGVVRRYKRCDPFDVASDNVLWSHDLHAQTHALMPFSKELGDSADISKHTDLAL